MAIRLDKNFNCVAHHDASFPDFPYGGVPPQRHGCLEQGEDAGLACHLLPVLPDVVEPRGQGSDGGQCIQLLRVHLQPQSSLFHIAPRQF